MLGKGDGIHEQKYICDQKIRASRMKRKNKFEWRMIPFETAGQHLLTLSLTTIQDESYKVHPGDEIQTSVCFRHFQRGKKYKQEVVKYTLLILKVETLDRSYPELSPECAHKQLK